MGKILRSINLFVDALKPKQITWNLNKDGTGYEVEEKELKEKFDLENPTLDELDIPYEAYLTSSGIPWCGPTKKTTPIQNQQLANHTPKIEEYDDQKDEQKIIKEMQETLASRLIIQKLIEKQYPSFNLELKTSNFTQEELAREKKADSETRRRLHLLLDESKPEEKLQEIPKTNNPDLEKCKFTKEELTREKKIDREMRKKLQAILEEVNTEKQKDIATLFDPLQGKEYYLNRYQSEPPFKAWFDSNFEGCSIQQVLDLAIPVTFAKIKPQPKLDLHYKNSDLQKYIDKYNKEPMYKDWFDRKYPGYTIYDIIGVTKPQ